MNVQKDISSKDLKQYQQEGYVAVDTELQGLRLRRDAVCMIQVCDRKGLVRLVHTAQRKQCPPNLKTLFQDKNTVKVFHYALADVAFLRTCFDIEVNNVNCTKIMSKLVRTYTDKHNLANLTFEIMGRELPKVAGTSDWTTTDLSAQQLQYAANDVLDLLSIYDHLQGMIVRRDKLPSGISVEELNAKCQAHLPTLIDLIINGYHCSGDTWRVDVFEH